MQKVKLKLAKEFEEKGEGKLVEGKDVLLEDIVPMKSNDELLQLTQLRLGRSLTSDEVRVLEGLGPKVRAHFASQMRAAM